MTMIMLVCYILVSKWSHNTSGIFISVHAYHYVYAILLTHTIQIFIFFCVRDIDKKTETTKKLAHLHLKLGEPDIVNFNPSHIYICFCLSADADVRVLLNSFTFIHVHLTFQFDVFISYCRV